jgi:hypothetical protein
MDNPCRAEYTMTAFWPVGWRRSCDPFHSGDKNSFRPHAATAHTLLGQISLPMQKKRPCDGKKPADCDDHV